jgi:hypothetical protein
VTDSREFLVEHGWLREGDQLFLHPEQRLSDEGRIQT